jgi:hypothetical protein
MTTCTAQMLGQQRLDAEIPDKEIACILSAFVRTSGQHCQDEVLLWQLHAEKVQPSGL